MSKPNFKLLDDFDNSFFKDRRIMSGVNTPSVGLYKVGDIVISETQTEDCIGWICTAAGEPGTWVKFGHKGDINIPDIPEIDLTKYALKDDVGNKTNLSTENKTDLVSAINELKTKSDQAFQSGNNAKQGLVDALVAKGVEASTSENWDMLNGKVKNNLEKPYYPHWYRLTDEYIDTSYEAKEVNSSSYRPFYYNGYIYVYQANLSVKYNVKTNVVTDNPCKLFLEYRKIGSKNNLVYRFSLEGDGVYDIETSDQVDTTPPYTFGATNDYSVNNISESMYIFGGMGGALKYFNNNVKYDIKNKIYTEVTPLPNSFVTTNGWADTLNDDIYIYSGMNSIYFTKYDTILDTYTDKSTNGIKHGQRYQIKTFKGLIHKIGNHEAASHEEYDPTTNTWTVKKEPPINGNFMYLVPVDDLMYLVSQKMYCYLP